MKRKSAILGLSLALALSGLWSCEKGIGETDKIEAGNTVNLTLKSDLSDQTRTSISYDETSGKYKPAWEAEEHIGVFVGENKNKDFKNSGAGQSTQFNGNVSLTAGTYKVYTYYPYDGKTSSDNTPSDTRIELPSVQKPTLESFDGAADIMVGYPLDLTLSADEDTPILEGLRFKRLMATLKIVPSDIASQVGSEPVTRVRLTAGEATLTGRVKIDLENCKIHDDGFYSSGNYKCNYAEAQYDAADNFQLDGKNAAFLVVNPTTVAAGQTLTLEIETANYKITKTATLSSEMSLAAGEITPLRMNLGNGTTIESTSTGLALPFTEDFATVTTGTFSNSGSSGIFPDDTKFLLVNGDVYGAGKGIIRVGKDKGTIIRTKEKLNLSQPFSITIKGCGWKVSDGSEDELYVTVGNVTDTIKFTKIATNYSQETYTLDFDAVSAAEYVYLQPERRCFIDEIIIESTGPKISASNIDKVPAKGVTNATATYTAKNFTDDVSVSAFTGNVTSATAAGGIITYSVAPNYTGAATEGTITLSSASAPEVTVKVSQLADEFTVTPAEIVLGGTSGSTKTFTVTSTYAWTASAAGSGYTVSPENGEAGTTEITVTATADGATEQQQLGTVTVTRTTPEPNPKTAQVTVSQSAAGAAKEPVILYSTEFNYEIKNNNNYQNAEPYEGKDTDGKAWYITYGNWNSSNCAQFRVYKAGNFGILYNDFDIANVTSVTYKANVSNTALKLNTYYSTNSGKTWVQVDNNKALTKTSTEYTFVVSETGEYSSVRIKFEAAGTKPTSSNYQLTIDDVSIYGLQ